MKPFNGTIIYSILFNCLYFRQAALDEERKRAAMIASLPPPDPDPLLDINIPTSKSFYRFSHYKKVFKMKSVKRDDLIYKITQYAK